MMMPLNIREAISEERPSTIMGAHADGVYNASIDKEEDLEKLLESAGEWLSSVRHRSHAFKEVISKDIRDTMARAIYGSNMIERVGLGYDITVHLCRQFFTGEEECDNTLLELYRLESELKEMDPTWVLQGRSEVVQHAKAFLHIMYAFVVEKEDLTEELIKETHRILTTGVPIMSYGMNPAAAPEKYGGIYRKVTVRAGNTNFTVPRFIPTKVKDMCDAFRQEVVAAETQDLIDPFSMAAKYSSEFAQIRPFRDGNGRICQLILNAILCRYAGVIIPIGEREEERKEYTDITKQSTQGMEGYGECATFILRKAVVRLWELKRKMHVASRDT